jgi:hypothetical protein
MAEHLFPTLRAGVWRGREVKQARMKTMATLLV